MNTRLSEREQARSFGRSVGTVLLLIGLYQLWRGRMMAAAILVSIGALLALFGTFAPMAIRLPSRLWWRFSAALGWINSRIILSLFFFLILTPVGLLFRLMGRDPLARRDKETMWSPYPPRPRNHFERMF